MSLQTIIKNVSKKYTKNLEIDKALGSFAKKRVWSFGIYRETTHPNFHMESSLHISCKKPMFSIIFRISFNISLKKTIQIFKFSK